MTPEFVGLYNHPGVKNVYRNLARISEETSVYQSLVKIQQQERMSHQVLMQMALDGGDPCGVDSRDLSRSYHFNAHYLAVSFLFLCGFRCITDRSYVRMETLHDMIRADESRIVDNLGAIQNEFGSGAQRSIVGADMATYVEALGLSTRSSGRWAWRSGPEKRRRRIRPPRWSKTGKLLRSGTAAAGPKPHILESQPVLPPHLVLHRLPLLRRPGGSTRRQIRPG